jgi:replicative superfamily II helicase
VDSVLSMDYVGSGKTTILEAAFLQVFERSRGNPATKVVYIAPVKALLQER